MQTDFSKPRDDAEVPDTRGPRRRFLVACVLAGFLPPRDLTQYVIAELSVDEGRDE